MIESDGLDWLRRAVGRDYRVDRDVGEPGDVVHAVGRDLSLDRPVELLALRPEAVSEARTRQFREWAQLMARVNHPNTAGVHRAQVEGSVPYCVLEHPDGETLAARLRIAPLGAGDGVSLGRDLLRGLEASHAAGVVRPGLEPGVIVCAPGRNVIVRLGRPLDGTASVQADLYAAAVVLYEAVAGRPWISGDSAAVWAPVPRRLRPVLRRALASDPDERWPDAAAFRRRLERLSRSPREWPPAATILRGVTLMAAGAGAWAVWRPVSGWLWPDPIGVVAKELAVLPLEVASDSASEALGLGVASTVQRALDDLPGLELTPFPQVVQYWERHGRDVDGADAARDLRVHWAAHGLLTRRGDSVVIRLTLTDSLGNPEPVRDLRGGAQALADLCDTLALLVLRTVAPELEPVYAPLSDLSGVPLGALKAFFQGEAAFGRDAWELAEQHYRTATGEDSSFALARWRLANVERWRRETYRFDLRDFYERLGHRLRPRDRAQVEALLEPDVERRLRRFETAVASAPGDAYTRFLYAEELFHRGPLVGLDLERAARAMRDVIEADSSFAEAYNHLFIIDLRAGRASAARRDIELRRRVAVRPAPGDPDIVRLLQLAYDERFVPWRGAMRLWYLRRWADSAMLADVARVARLGVAWFDIPETQIALDRLLLQRWAFTDSARASARTGIALGLMATGRTDEALAQLDSAVGLFRVPEARLQQAEWRAIPQFLGLPAARTAADPAWGARLEELVADSAIGTRALWALALRALAADSTAAFERYRAKVDSAVPASPLAALLRAIGEGARGRAAAALAISDSIRPLLAVNHPPDVFAGAVFHLRRGDWFAAQGDRAMADREWAWYEGSDFEGWPAGVPQAGEIEGAFSAYAGWKRGLARLAGAATTADTVAACALLARSTTRWREAEPVTAALRDSATRLMTGCPG